MNTTMNETKAHVGRAVKSPLHPVLMMLGVLLVALALTYVLGAGEYTRHGKTVVAGSYQAIEKTASWSDLFSLAAPTSTPERAYPASFISLIRTIPDGLSKTSGLIFMVMFVGGMFEIFKETGALDAGLDRLVIFSRGNMYVLSAILIVAVGMGGTFLGLASEYLVLLPVLLALGQRLNVPPIMSLAILEFGGRLGYAASISNPVVLPIAQSVLEVPLFSGAGIRAVVFVTFIVLAVAYFAWKLKRTGYEVTVQQLSGTPMTAAHRCVLAVIVGAVFVLIFVAPRFKWHYGELSAFYIFLAGLLGILGRLKGSVIAEAFVKGMRNMMLAGLLIGLAATVELVLQRSLVLDTVIERLSSWIAGHSPTIVASGIMGLEAMLDLLLPSTSGKAAISMPILAPIAHMSGLGSQTTVLAFLFGGGLMGAINPTSGLTLAYLAIAQVGYGQWVKFAVPLMAGLALVGIGFLWIAVQIGY